jgi:hypothetical protein
MMRVVAPGLPNADPGSGSRGNLSRMKDEAQNGWLLPHAI